MLSSSLLKSKNSHVEGGGLTEFDADFKFAKIQNSHVEGGGGACGKIQNSHVGGGLMEFDAEFKFAKIQNSRVEGGVGGGSWNLMLSSNLLKSKIPMLGGAHRILC